MSNLSQFFSGGGSANRWFRNRRIYSTSGNFTTSGKGKLYIFAVAGGGSGSARLGSPQGYCTGGGAGECAFDVLDVVAGQSFTVTIGAGGGAVTSGPGNLINGNAGGNTSITGPNSYSLTVNGGPGGIAAVARPRAGVAGGTGGTGGSSKVVRYQGGGSGDINATADGMYATGGGAVNFYGLPPLSVTSGSISQGVAPAATGGAGIAGRSGSLTNGSATWSGGGSSAEAAVDNSVTAGGARTAGESYLIQESFWRLDIFGAGVNGFVGSSPGGGGSGGGALASNAGGGGFLGGGASCASTGNAGTAGSGGIGAGGGGCASSATQAISGAGGNGYVVFIEIPE